MLIKWLQAEQHPYSLKKLFILLYWFLNEKQIVHILDSNRPELKTKLNDTLYNGTLWSKREKT